MVRPRPRLFIFVVKALLFVLTFFVRVGEFVVYIPKTAVKIGYLHLKAFGYLSLHVHKQTKYAVLRGIAFFLLKMRALPHAARQVYLLIDKAASRIAQNGKRIPTYISKRLLAVWATRKHSRTVAAHAQWLTQLARKAKTLSPPYPLARKPEHYTHLVPKHIRLKYIRLQIVAIAIVVTVAILLTHTVYRFYISLPSPRDIGRINYSLTTHLYDRNGKSLFDFYKDQDRTPITLKTLPPYVSQATVAIEDKDFYHHKGVSVLSGIARAFKETVILKKGVQGGSTITQQLVKTALLSPERSFTRKIKEVIIALEAEQIYTKDQILQMYLNQVPYGGSVYGIQEASRRFFHKNATELTIAQAALLAGLPQAPSEYSPFTHPDAAKRRQKQVLAALLEQGYITQKEHDHAVKEQLVIAKDSIAIEAPHFVFYVRDALSSYFDISDLYQSGFRVKTTLDLDIQKQAERILKEELAKVQYLNVSNGAILVTKPSTGEILAMVGSADYFDGKSGAFNVITGLRQPGSSIKPLVYAAAMQKGLTAASLIDDVPTVFQISTTEVYRPVNYDGRFHGRVTVRYALANSYNIPAVKTMSKVGVAPFIAFAKQAGIDTWSDPDNYGLSLSLGGGEVTMIDMAEAYSVLANKGARSNVYAVSDVVDVEGNDVISQTPAQIPVVDPAIAYILSDVLSDNQARVSAFGPRSALEVGGYKVAVKTGTTDEKRDNWTIGYTPDYLVVVWVGNNDHSPMNPYLASGITGAAPIWNRVMAYLLQTQGKGKKNWYEKPTNVVQKPCMGRNEFFVAGTENTVPCVLPRPAKTITPSDTKRP